MRSETRELLEKLGLESLINDIRDMERDIRDAKSTAEAALYQFDVAKRAARGRHPIRRSRHRL